MTGLTENRIKKLALSYLKNYYKYRPRTENHNVYALLDQKLEGGILVDVMLIFGLINIMYSAAPKEDDKTKERALALVQQKHFSFIATCEATSRSEAYKELYYKFDIAVWLWESLAAALFFSAGVFLYADMAPQWFPEQLQFLARPFEHNKYSLWQWIGFFNLLTAFFFIPIALLSKYWNKLNIRYRNIYAIRQFRAYAADEQWIAFSEDAFSAESDENEDAQHWKDTPYFLELHRQALANGIGLLVVTKQEKIIPLSTPARAYEGKEHRLWRKIIPSDLPNTVGKNINKSKKKLLQLLRLAPNRNDFFKLQRSILLPVSLSFCFIILIVYITAKHYAQRPGERISSHAKELSHWTPTKQANWYHIDTLYIDTPFWPAHPPFLFDSTRFIDPITLRMRKREQQRQIPLPLINPLPPLPSEPAPAPPDAPRAEAKKDSCISSFGSWLYPVYVILYGVWPEEQDARAAADKLALHNIQTQLLPARCFKTDHPFAENDFLLILSPPLSDEETVNKQVKNATETLLEKQLLRDSLALSIIKLWRK